MGRNNSLDEVVYGNVALSAQPKVKPQVEREHENKQNKLDPFKIFEFSKREMVALGIMFMLCIAFIIVDIYVGSQIKNTQREISMLKNKISTVQSENDAIQFSINSKIDTNKIYKIATKKLGMVQAKEKQIINYKSSDSGYTVQYKDIPEE